jgi:[acyl-carrier-protein] S-malonyltransferase
LAVLAILAPGQGSQTPGFLTPWLADSESAAQIAHWSSLIDLDLARLGTTADADEIRDTANAQPLLVAGALLGTTRLFGADTSAISYVAGHSVGELAAAAISGVISSDDAISLVRTRGVEMAKAAAVAQTGMSAVLGGERDVVVAALTSLGLTAANENGAGQIVAAGDLAALAALAENPPAGSRVRPLAVAGAFHTAVMQPAVSVLAEKVRAITSHNPVLSILSNKDGAVVDSGEEVLARIVGQVAGPVRWDLCMETLAALGVTGVIEAPPAGTLVGLVKRATPDVETFALKSPDDLAAAREFVSKHGAK